MTTEKLHILHIPGWYPTPNDPAFGIFIQKHIEAVHQLNDSSVIYLQKGNAPLEVMRQNPFEIYASFKVSSFPMIKQFALITNYQRALKRAYNQLVSQHRKPDIVHFHMLNAYSLVAQRFFKQKGIPYVISEHWSGYTNGLFVKKSTIYKNQIFRLTQKAIGISTVSTFLKDHMQRLGLTSTHFSVIPNVVSFPKNMLKKPPNTDTIRIVNISDLVDQTKNISGLLKAFKPLAEKHTNAELHIIGKGADFEYLRELGNELGLSDQIRWHGYVPHCRLYLLGFATRYAHLCENRTRKFSRCSNP